MFKRGLSMVLSSALVMSAVTPAPAFSRPPVFPPSASNNWAHSRLTEEALAASPVAARWKKIVQWRLNTRLLSLAGSKVPSDRTDTGLLIWGTQLHNVSSDIENAQPVSPEVESLIGQSLDKFPDTMKLYNAKHLRVSVAKTKSNEARAAKIWAARENEVVLNLEEWKALARHFSSPDPLRRQVALWIANRRLHHELDHSNWFTALIPGGITLAVIAGGILLQAITSPVFLTIAVTGVLLTLLRLWHDIEDERNQIGFDLFATSLLKEETPNIYKEVHQLLEEEPLALGGFASSMAKWEKRLQEKPKDYYIRFWADRDWWLPTLLALFQYARAMPAAPEQKPSLEVHKPLTEPVKAVLMDLALLSDRKIWAGLANTVLSIVSHWGIHFFQGERRKDELIQNFKSEHKMTESQIAVITREGAGGAVVIQSVTSELLATLRDFENPQSVVDFLLARTMPAAPPQAQELVRKVEQLSRVPGGITAGEGLADSYGRVFRPDGRFFTAEGDMNADLKKFMDSLSEKSVQEMVKAGIMYYDIRSGFWREHPEFTVAFALAFAKKIQEKTGKKDGLIIHLAVDAYQHHFEAAQVFADAILRSGITDNGGGIYYWGVRNGGSIRNYAQLYEATHHTGGDWVFFTQSHRTEEDISGAKLGIDGEVFCGPEIRHVGSVRSGTLYDGIIDVQNGHAPITHREPEGAMINVVDTSQNDVKVAADLIRATSAIGKDHIPDNQLLTGAKLFMPVDGRSISMDVVKMLRALGADIKVNSEEVDPHVSPKFVRDPNEHHKREVLEISEEVDALAEEGDLRIGAFVDPDGDRAGFSSKVGNAPAVTMPGSELVQLVVASLAATGKKVTAISDMRTGVGAKDLETALVGDGQTVKVVPFEAGYSFFMRGMAELPADVAIENTLHFFMTPMTNELWGAPRTMTRPGGKGYQGGDDAGLAIAYVVGAMVHQWEGRNPLEQLHWLQQKYQLKPTVTGEKKPALNRENDIEKYYIAERMKALTAAWFGGDSRFQINFNNPDIEVVSGVHLLNNETGAMVLTRYSNSGPGFTISGEAYRGGPGRENDQLNEMLGLGYLLMAVAIEQLRNEGHRFTFDWKDAATLKGAFVLKKYGLPSFDQLVAAGTNNPAPAEPGPVERVRAVMGEELPPGSLLFWPNHDFMGGAPLSEIKPTRSADEVLQLLKNAKSALTIEGHLRGVDGAGSSLDLPEFQVKLTPAGGKTLADVTSTPTVASKFTAKIRFELAEDPGAIEYVAPDYGVRPGRPYHIRGPVTLKEGRTPNGQLDAPAYIFQNVFHLKGIRIAMEGIDAMAQAGGMESSNVFNVALIAAASMLSGAGLSQAEIFNLAVKLENNEFNGLAGGQGHLCTLLGGVYRNVWLSGKTDPQGHLPYGSLSIPLVKPNRFLEIEDHMMLVQAGKDYESGKALVGRTASSVNKMWTDLLHDNDLIGLPLHQEKLGLTDQYTRALATGDYETVVRVLNRYVEIRDQITLRWVNLLLDAHEGKTVGYDGQPVPHYAQTYVEKVFTNPKHKDYKDFKIVRDMAAHPQDLRATNLYTFGPIRELVRAAREQGIAIMPLGAGGPGANLIAVSAKGNAHLRSFLESHGLHQLTNDQARTEMTGAGRHTLKGYMPFRVGPDPLQIKGFQELGLEPPAGPIKINPSPAPAAPTNKLNLLQDVPDEKFRGAVVLIRADLNVLDDEGNIASKVRILKSLPSIQYALKRGARVILMSHVQRPKGQVVEKWRVNLVRDELEKALGAPVKKIDQWTGPNLQASAESLTPGEVLLSENTRFDPREESENPAERQELAQEWVKFTGAQIFVNDAFDADHRAHASTVEIAQSVPLAVAGLSLQEDIAQGNKVLELLPNAEHPVVAVFGGAKAKDKLPFVEAIQSDVSLVGGLMAKKFPVEAVEKIQQKGTRVKIATDEAAGGRDIGPETTRLFEAEIANAKTIIWNGPVGKFEDDDAEDGTFAVARAVATATKRGALTIVVGGDTVASTEKAKLTAKDFTLLVSGGGAMLEYIASGGKLPGIEALRTPRQTAGGQAAAPKPLIVPVIDDVVNGIVSQLRLSGVGSEHGRYGEFADLAKTLDAILIWQGTEYAADLLNKILNDPSKISSDPQIQSEFLTLVRSILSVADWPAPAAPATGVLETVVPLLKNAPVEPPKAVEPELEKIAELTGIDINAVRRVVFGSLDLKLLITDLSEAGLISSDQLNQQLLTAQLGPETFPDITNIDEWVDRVAELLKTPSERIRWILVNAIDPQLFVEAITRSGNGPQLMAQCVQAGVFPSVFSKYLMSLIRNDKGDHSRKVKITINELISHEALAYAQGTLKISASLPNNVEIDQDARDVLDYHFRVICAESATRVFNYRSGVMEYFENVFGPEMIPVLNLFIHEHFTARKRQLRYMVSSGIGANEEYTRQLAQEHNARDPAIRWIVVNNPLEWEEIKEQLRKDADWYVRLFLSLPTFIRSQLARIGFFERLSAKIPTAQNTLFFDISRSGDTQETVKTFEFSYKEFPYRIVAANKGPLRQLAERHNKDGNIRLIPLPSDIGGRLMRRKSPMVYAPMHLAGMDVRKYAEATDRFDRELAFDKALHNLAISFAEFLVTMFVADHRNGIVVLANGKDRDSPLFHSMGEVQQLHMEGGQKFGSPLATMLVQLLPHHSHKDLEGILAQAEHFVAILLLARHSGLATGDKRLAAEDVANPRHAGLTIDDVLFGLAEGNADSIVRKMPTLRIDIDKPTPETAAAIATFWEDVCVYYTALTGQDPNSNPEVAKVRVSGSKRLVEVAQAGRAIMPMRSTRSFVNWIMAKIRSSSERLRELLYTIVAEINPLEDLGVAFLPAAQYGASHRDPELAVFGQKITRVVMIFVALVSAAVAGAHGYDLLAMLKLVGISVFIAEKLTHLSVNISALIPESFLFDASA